MSAPVTGDRETAGVKDESDKPPMPAHEYADQWARDTIYSPQDAFSWGERNLARCYLALAGKEMA